MTRPSVVAHEPYVSTAAAGGGGFGVLLHAEWTKLRTVRGWVAALLIGALLTMLVGVVSAAGSKRECAGPNGQPCAAHLPPTGPNGMAVTDRFTLVHQEIGADGTITARVVSLTGVGAGGDNGAEPWAKAGLIVKADLQQGSRYAAVMSTGGHGVRWQHDFTADAAGPVANPGSPTWLRLTRHGDTLTGYSSPDGVSWTAIGTVRIPLPATAQIGMFVTSPDHVVTVQRFGGTETFGDSTTAVGVFDHVTIQGGTGNWATELVGDQPGARGPFSDAGDTAAGGTFTLKGAGDIAPQVAGQEGNTVERSLVGVFAGLIAMIVLGALFFTCEYRRGLIGTTFAARPQRGQVLAAKAVVIGVVTFVVGLVAAAPTYWIVGAMRRNNGIVVLPVSWQTEVRTIVGTAALLAVSSVLAVGVGAVLRRGIGAVALAVGLMVLPYLLSVASVLPTGVANVLLRVTPAAGFAIQQTSAAYPQVDAAYLPSSGYFPLSPLGGFAVLAGWTVLALLLGAIRLRRQDAVS